MSKFRSPAPVWKQRQEGTARPAARAAWVFLLPRPAPQSLWAAVTQSSPSCPCPHFLPSGGSGGPPGGDAAACAGRAMRCLSVPVTVSLPAGLRGAGPPAALSLCCRRKQRGCGSCRQGPPGQRGAPEAQGQWDPPLTEGQMATGAPQPCPSARKDRRHLGRGRLGLGPGGRAGPSAGHTASGRSRNEMQPEAGPKTQRDLGVRVPSSHP